MTIYERAESGRRYRDGENDLKTHNRVRNGKQTRQDTEEKLLTQP